MELPHVSRAVMGLTALIVAYTLLQYLILYRRRAAFARSKGCLPAVRMPQTDRLFGIDIFRENMRAAKEHTFFEVFARRFEVVGATTFSSTVLGRYLHITIEPENLKTIQAIDAKKWSLGSRRKNAFYPLLGWGIFTTDGQAWQHSRDMLRPNFARSQVGDLPTFEKHVKHLIDAVPTDGTTIDLSELFFRLTMDSATEFLFGESTESLTKGSSKGFAESFTRAQETISNRSRMGIWANLFPANKHFAHDQKFVHDFVDYYVQRGLAKRSQLLAEKSNADKPGRYVFIDELVRQTTDPIRIRSELLNILLAGRDTTASLLTNVWWTLSQRPDLWEKLQREIATLDGAAPSFDELKDLKFLRALLNESLRLHPVVPGNSREAVEDTTLPVGGGPDGRAPLFIKKGNVVVWSVWSMHRRKDFYGEDAEEFKPERWLDNAATGTKGLRPGWEYLPFNGGARICLGQQFALTEASYTTVRMCQAFSVIEKRDTLPWTEGLTLTCVNFNGAKVALKKRED